MSFDLGIVGERIVTGLIVGMFGALSQVGVVLFVVIFILLEAPTFQRRLSRALNWEVEGFADIQDTLGEVHKYLSPRAPSPCSSSARGPLWESPPASP
jgi:predicted PurR-regulated permease PerM